MRQLVFFQKWTARHDKLKTSVKHQPRRCKGRKLTSPNLRGRSNRGVRLRDPADKHASTRIKFKVSVMICCLYFYLAETVVSCFGTPFFLRTAACYRVINKPWCMFKSLAFVNCYHGEVTTMSKMSF